MRDLSLGAIRVAALEFGRRDVQLGLPDKLRQVTAGKPELERAAVSNVAVYPPAFEP